jgi:hypothetical protein
MMIGTTMCRRNKWKMVAAIMLFSVRSSSSIRFESELLSCSNRERDSGALET